jgi:2-hydroxychromene-2-carboxylate isomerase
MTIADWYFDFVSPFAYLQSEQLASLAPKLTVRYKPVLFAGLLGAIGQKGPAEIPAKRAFTYRFCIWQAKRLGVAFRFPPEHPFNPLLLLRLAIACDSSPEAVHRIFRFVWRDGRLPDLPIEWAELVGELGVPDADARIASPEVKDELRRNTDQALARGVFGVPTLAIGGELFWGVDATPMAADYVAAGCRFDDPEYARVARLPVGAERRDVAPKVAPGRKGKTRVVGTAS